MLHELFEAICMGLICLTLFGLLFAVMRQASERSQIMLDCMAAGNERYQCIEAYNGSDYEAELARKR
jgi:hypothetical protein